MRRHEMYRQSSPIDSLSYRGEFNGCRVPLCERTTCQGIKLSDYRNFAWCEITELIYLSYHLIEASISYRMHDNTQLGLYHEMLYGIGPAVSLHEVSLQDTSGYPIAENSNSYRRRVFMRLKQIRKRR